jgi:NADPH:quinone reductase-like Zn-dependent oxidoreductase
MSTRTRHVLDGGTFVTGALVTEHGQPARIGEHRLSQPGSGQCLIRVTAAPIVPLDLLCASGTSYFGPPGLPYVPGVQGVGVVVRAETLSPGTRVWFNTHAGMRPGDGSLAEAAVVDESETVRLPAGVEDAAVAALGLSAVAAWHALSRAELRAGEQVLVTGASGVVGQVAVQLAVALGAGRIVAATRSAEGRDRALRIGADAVVDLAGADIDGLEARIREAVDGRLDVVIDPVCGDSATAALRVLGAGGRLVNLGSAGGPTAAFDSASLRSRSHTILGYTNASLTLAQRAEALSGVLRLAADGRCEVDYQTVDLDAIGDAWRLVASGSHTARAVVLPGRARD